MAGYVSSVCMLATGNCARLGGGVAWPAFMVFNARLGSFYGFLSGMELCQAGQLSWSLEHLSGIAKHLISGRF